MLVGVGWEFHLRAQHAAIRVGFESLQDISEPVSVLCHKGLDHSVHNFLVDLILLLDRTMLVEQDCRAAGDLPAPSDDSW
jgi:hypothetical protein